jgi:signal-transduction protein with cAMP-binding, CBS, and nucleotidyltransferase domain
MRVSGCPASGKSDPGTIPYIEHEAVSDTWGIIVSCKVEELIRGEVPSLEEATTVRDAARVMATRNLGSCVVTRDGQVVGLFTERDLLTRVVAEGHNPSELSLGEVCSRDLIRVDYDSSCREAVMKMRARLSQRVLVYRGQRFLGVVKLPDLAYAMASRRWQKDMLVNAIGAVTLSIVVAVIALLLIQLPELVNFLGRGSRP